MKNLKVLFFNKMRGILMNRQSNDEDDEKLTRKNGFNDYVASIILLIISVLIGLKFKTELTSQFASIFTWWGTNMNTLTGSTTTPTQP